MMLYRNKSRPAESVSAWRDGFVRLLSAAVVLGAMSSAHASSTDNAESSNALPIENSSLYSLGSDTPHQPQIALGSMLGEAVSERIAAGDEARPELYDFTAGGPTPAADELTAPYLSGLNPAPGASAGGGNSPVFSTFIGGLLGLAILLAAALTDSKQHRRKTISSTHR